MRSALPYCFSILPKNPLSVVLSWVLPANNFVGEWKTLRRDDQRNDHLYAVATLVAAITEAPIVGVIGWRITLEIGAGQIVEQHLEA